jgi:hypothetical protein
MNNFTLPIPVHRIQPTADPVASLNAAGTNDPSRPIGISKMPPAPGPRGAPIRLGEPPAGRYTVAEDPPNIDYSRQCRSFWRGVLDEGRCHPGQWRKVDRAFRKSTAAQLASDAHLGSKHRTTGFLPGDRFVARWHEGPITGECFIYIQYVGVDTRG